jgi:hypothetical protein
VGEVLCADGDDGEGDGFVDCSDPECQNGWECVPPAPVGWEGPFVVDAIAGVADSTCPDGGDERGVLFGGLVGTQCSACDCAAPTCPFEFECGASATCTSGASAVEVTEGCQPAPVAEGTCRWSAGTPTSCVASGGEVVGAPVGTTLRLCSYPQATGCEAGSVCAARASGPRGTCITKVGVQSECPAPFPLRLVAYTDLDDARWCSPCVCALDEPAVCTSGSVVTYTGTNCLGIDDPLAEQSCSPVSWESLEVVLPELTAGVCGAATGGLPKGEVKLDGPTTVCCREAEGGA